MSVNRHCNFRKRNGSRKKTNDFKIQYKDFTIEMELMWNVKTKMIPVVRATGTI
jgi:hypothetical protein